MKPKRITRTILPALLVVAGAASAAAARADDDEVKTRLGGYQENPSISTTATGRFRAQIDGDTRTIAYELSYAGIDSVATMAHIHVGQRWQNGGIAAFLCAASNPAVPVCPANGGTVTGTITAADVIGPEAQGIAPGEFDELVEAIERGVAYVNVHSTTYPGGEIRGQLRGHD